MEVAQAPIVYYYLMLQPVEGQARKELSPSMVLLLTVVNTLGTHPETSSETNSVMATAVVFLELASDSFSH